MKTTKVKTFDAVKIQREIREKISSETANMSFTELKKYIKQIVRESGFKPIGGNIETVQKVSQNMFLKQSHWFINFKTFIYLIDTLLIICNYY